MTTEKKIPKKRGRKPKKIEKKKEKVEVKSIKENLIIQLKKSHDDEYNIQSYDNTNEVNEVIKDQENKSELCWNCCHPFHSHIHGIPMKYTHGIFYVYGDFCSLECGCRYAHDNLKDYNFEELFSLINLYSNIILEKKEKIEMAPNRLLLKSFGGPLSIEEYRSKNILNYEIRIPPILPINHSINKYESIHKTTNKDFLKLYRKKPIQSDKKSITTSMNLIIDK
tara:strand:- start:35 stop:706 length:672 start_codon:yes stop_codon:yes gene_type:complete